MRDTPKDIPMISYNEEPTVNDVAAQNISLSNMARQDGYKTAANYQHEKETGVPSQFWQMADNQNIHKVFDPEALHPKLVDLIAGNPDKVSYFKDDLPVWNKIMDALDKLPNKNEQRPVPQNGTEEDSTWWNNLVPSNPIPGLREAADKIGALAYDTIRSAADAVNPFVAGENMSLADREKLSERTDKVNRVNALMRIMFGYLTEKQFNNTSDEDLQRAFTELGKIHDIRTDDLSVADFRNLPYLEGVKPSELINFFGAIEGGKAIERLVNPELRPENLANVDETSPVYLQLAKLQALEEENEMLRGISKASEVTNGVLMSLRLMAEIAATGGTSKAVQAAGQTGFREIYHAAGVPGVINKFGSNLVKGLWGIAKQNAKRLPLFAAQGAAEAYNQDYLGGVVSVIDENGVHVEASEPELKDFWLGLVTHMFEHANEMATEELGELLPLNQLSNFVPKRVRNAIIARLGIDPMTRNITYGMLKKHIPITGATGEWMEEEFANFNSRAATIILEEVNKFFGNDTPITPGTENWTIMFGDKRERDVTAMSLLSQQALFGGAVFIGNYARGYRPHPFRPLEARARFMREKEAINEIVDRLPHTPLLNSPAATEAVLDSAVGDAAWVIPFEEADALMQQANSDELSTEDKEDMKGALNAMGITEKAVENAKKNGRDLILSRNAVITTMSHGNFKTARDLGNKIMENAVNAEYGVFGAKNIEVTKDTFNKKMLEEMDRIAAEQAEFGAENIQTIRNAIEKARADEEERAKAEGRAPNVMRESFTKSLDGYYSLMNCIMRYLWVGGKAEAKAAVKDMIEKLSFRFAENPEQFNLQKAYADTEAAVKKAAESGKRLSNAETRYRDALAKFGEEEKKQQERQKADPNAVNVDQSYTDAYNELQESINELNLARKEAEAAKTAHEAPAEEPLNQIIGRAGLANLVGEEEADRRIAEAEAMEAAKDKSAKIWAKTGLQRGVDGEWRAEIPDIRFSTENSERFASDLFSFMDWYGDIINNMWSLQSLVDAPDLFDAYPQLRNLKVEFVNLGNSATRGMYVHSDRRIYLNENTFNSQMLNDKMERAAASSSVDEELRKEIAINAAGMLSTLAHEIQHAIQSIEGFARGSSPEEMQRDQYAINSIDGKLKKLMKKGNRIRSEHSKKGKVFRDAFLKAGFKITEDGKYTEYGNALFETEDAVALLKKLKKENGKAKTEIIQALEDFIKVSKKMDAFHEESKKIQEDYLARYKRVAGEVESRNVQARMRKQFLDRLGIPLSETEDTPRDEQIVLYQVSPVWTGSAASYDQPSLHYVGTGEGNQVYGWGLYGSSSRQVAEWYAKKDFQRKSKPGKLKFRGNEVVGPIGVAQAFEDVSDYRERVFHESALRRIQRYVEDSYGSSLPEIVNMVKEEPFPLYDGLTRERWDSIIDEVAKDLELVPGATASRNLYKQTFWADKEEDLLDWEEFVSTNQAENVARGLFESLEQKDIPYSVFRLAGMPGHSPMNPLYDLTVSSDPAAEDGSQRFFLTRGKSDGHSVTISEDGTILRNAWNDELTGRPLSDLVGESAAKYIMEHRNDEAYQTFVYHPTQQDVVEVLTPEIASMTGGELYEQLEDILGSPKAASEFLYRAGIDGVTYIGDSSGARNYVAFSDKDIRVDEHILFQGVRAATYGVSNIEKFAQSHEALMVLFKTADASTLPHESAHWLLAAMRALVSEGLGTEKMEQDLKTIDDWLAKQEYTEAAARRQGILHIGEDGKEYFDRKEMEQEYFARAFESYLLEGKLPETATSKLKTALRRLVEFFRAIYDDAKKLDVQMDPSITQFFDRIVAADYVSENHSVMSDILQAINEGALGMSNEELSNLEKALAGVREDAEAEKWLAALKAYLKGVKELTPDWKREANAAYDASKIEKAFVYVKGAGHKLYEGFLRENGFSEETIKTLRDKGLTVKNPYRGSKGPATDTATQTSTPYVPTETDEEFAKRWKEIPGDQEVTVTDEDMLGKIIYATMSGVEGRMLNKTAYTPSEYIGAVFDKLKKAELKPSSKKELMSLIWITADNLVRDDREKASRRNEVSADETQEDEEGNERSNGGGYGEAKSNAINQVGNADKEDFGLQKLLTNYVNGIKDSTKRRVAGAAASILIRKVLENGETEIKTADVIEEYKRLFGSNKNAQRSDDTLSEIWNGKNNGTGIKFQIARVLRESMQRQNELRQTPQGSTEAPQYIMKTLQDLGYETVDDLVADLLMANGKDAFIDDFMAQKLEEYKRAFMESPEWNSDAGATLYLDAILNALQLTKNMKFSQRVAAETDKAEREMKAEKTVGDMLKLQTVRGIETSLKASVARLLKTIKTNKGNREAAVQAAVEVHRLAAQLKVARQLHTDVEKSIRKAKKFGKMKAGATIDGDALNAIKALNRHFGLSNAKPNWTTGEGDPRTPYEVVKEMVRLRAEPMRFENDTEKQAYIASVINGIMNQWSEKMQNAMYLQSNEDRPNVEPFTDMKYDEFEELKHVLQFLYKASRDMMESVDGSFAADLKKRKEEIFNEMSANKTGDYSELDEVNGWEKTKSRVRSGLHIGKSLQWFAHLFSGYKEFYGDHALGAFRKYFELPIAEGESKQYYWQQKISGEIKPHLEALMRSCNERGVSAKINSENAIRHGGYGATIKGKPMAFVLLNAGNLGNRQRLMSGFGWSEDELSGILRQFSEEDYKHADAIWTSLAQLGREMADVFYKERHYRMKHVDSAKIELTNYEGKTIISQGGYYPLAYKYSGVRSSEDFDIMNPPHRPEKMAAPSSTMDREERVEDRIVRLDWSVLNKHIHEGSRYVGLWEPLHMANAIFRDKQFYRSVTENFGREAYDVFAKLMEYVNNPDMRYKYGKLANRVASIMATTALGFKVTTMEKQWASLWVGVDRLGNAGYFTDAFQAFWSNPKKFVDDVSEISPFLRDRYNLLDRDLTVLDTEFKKPVEQVADRYRMLAFWGMKKMDLCVAAIQWKAAFDFAQNTYKDMTISMCRAWADDFVASSQGAARTIDIPAVQLDAIGRMLTPFFGPACAAANTRIAGLSAFGKMDAGERISFAVENFVVPALMCAFIMAVANGLFRIDDDDDWDRVRRAFFRNLLAEPVSGIPFVQDVADAMVGVLVNGRASGRDVFEVGMLRPAEEMMSDAGKILVNIRNFDNLDQSLYIGARIAGEWYGMPVIQAGEDYEKMAIRNHFYPFENTIEKTLGDN